MKEILSSPERQEGKARIVFVGGKDVGHDIASYLIRKEDVLLIASNPSDVYAEHVWYKTVWSVANVFDIPYTTENINNKIEYLKAIEPDYLICAYYDKILKPEILRIPKKGCINIHMGLAEEYRGCYPTTFPILDGKDHAGITIHMMDETQDTGDILAQGKVVVGHDETGKSLYDKCTDVAVGTFCVMWDKIKNGEIKPRQQVTTEETKDHHRADFPSHKLDLTTDPEMLDRQIRALTFEPFPRPYFEINGHKFEIIFNKNES